MNDTYTQRVNQSIIRALRDVTDRTIAQQTADAMDYSPAELDDLVGRKIEEAPFSGDALARIIRARRGTARALGQVYPDASSWAEYSLWGSLARGGNRRMAAVGISDSEAIAYSTRRGDFGIPEWEIVDH